MSEPNIIIGYQPLTQAQAMAVRVAITNFHAETGTAESRNDLGPIADGYHARLGEVLILLFRSCD
jgi:hypothetical protein